MTSKEIINRRIECIGLHLVDYDGPQDTLERHLVAGELKNFYNKHIRGTQSDPCQSCDLQLERALVWKNKLYTPRNPRALGTMESLLLWMYIVVVSMPWLTYILIVSFAQTSRRKNVSMVNQWANFLLTKVLTATEFEMEMEGTMDECFRI